MKTLADIKRRIKPGVMMDCEHLQSGWKPGPREVMQVRTAQFSLKTLRETGFVESWCDYGYASNTEIIDENTFIVYRPWYIDGIENPRVPLLKYTFV